MFERMRWMAVIGLFVPLGACSNMGGVAAPEAGSVAQAPVVESPAPRPRLSRSLLVAPPPAIPVASVAARPTLPSIAAQPQPAVPAAQQRLAAVPPPVVPVAQTVSPGPSRSLFAAAPAPRPAASPQPMPVTTVAMAAAPTREPAAPPPVISAADIAPGWGSDDRWQPAPQRPAPSRAPTPVAAPVQQARAYDPLPDPFTTLAQPAPSRALVQSAPAAGYQRVAAQPRAGLSTFDSSFRARLAEWDKGNARYQGDAPQIASLD